MGRLWSALVVAAALCQACANDSGASGSTSPPPLVDGEFQYGVVYNGPAPQTRDINNFKVQLWDNLALSTRCGGCHVDGGQSPPFARTDDINLAYESANALVDLNDPESSRLVAKVGSGHNCWAGNNAFCAEKVTEWIRAWAADSGVELTQTQLRAPAYQKVGPSLEFSESADDFGAFVHPILVSYCGDCHRLDAPQAPQQPYFASGDVSAAYAAAQSKMLFNVTEVGEAVALDASGSRLVVRLGEESHNCWSDCAANAAEMERALLDMAAGFQLREADAALIASGAVRIADGTAISQGGRVETNAIALYPFKAGAGDTAFDYADGFPPAADLKLLGEVSWVSNWGLRFDGGRAQAAVSASAKLQRYITQTGEYSVEAWVIPANTLQDGPARIVSYSASNQERNFTLGQTLYNYDFLNRAAGTDVNGAPMLSTPDAAEVLKATLQHVVASFDPIEGRRLYVNGVAIDAPEPVGGGLLNEWDASFALVLGNETSGEYPWQGTLRFLAIHNRALSAEQVAINFEVGVGQKILLAFDIAEYLPQMEDAYVVFQVEQFDDYSYLFSAPYFFSFGDAPAEAVALQGLRLGVNGREARVGQVFANLNALIPAGHPAGEPYPLADLAAVIALEKGPEQDQFFLSFDRLGTAEHDRPEPPAPPLAEPDDRPPSAEIGVRSFGEINASLAAMTGISSVDPDIVATFARVEQQLPASPAAEGFLVSHQMGVTQLAVKYCNTLAADAGHRARFYPEYSPGVFDDAGRTAVIEPLLEALHACRIDALGGPLATAAEPAVSRAELRDLAQTLTAGCAGTCTPAASEKALTGICAAALGSALMLMQ